MFVCPFFIPVAADTVDEWPLFIIPHIVSCHSEVSGMDNQVNHKGGGSGEQFLSISFHPVGHFLDRMQAAGNTMKLH